MSKPGRTILASKIAETFNTEIVNNVVEYKKTHNDEGPLLVGFLANNDPAARMYATWNTEDQRIDGVPLRSKGDRGQGFLGRSYNTGE